MEKYASSKGYRLNPDEEVVMGILSGLLENEEKYGYRYCPCRPVTGDRQKDLPKICPCKWHEEELEQFGRCHCGLFVKDKQASPELVKLTDDTLKGFLQSHSFAVVDFWAEWCMPCKVLAPIVEELARKYEGEIAFGKLNVDESPATAREFEIDAIPALLFFRGGKVVDRVIGLRSRRELEQKMEILLKG
jgi:thioredoxin 1